MGWIFLAIVVIGLIIWGLAVLAHANLLEQSGYFNYTNYYKMPYYKIFYGITSVYYSRTPLQRYDDWVTSFDVFYNNCWVT